MKEIFKGVFGSRLYGLEGPTSDWDYKGVFLPKLDNLILQQAENTITTSTSDNSVKSGPNDTETQFLSIQKFIQLLGKGEMTVMDMLHTPDDKTVFSSEIWREIRRNRSDFYSKNMRGYFGYIQSQTAKYCDRSKRLETCENVIEFLKGYDKATRLSEFWEKVPSLPNTRIYQIPEARQEDNRVWEVVGRKLPATIKVEYALEILENYAKSYGARAIAARNNEGVDWKAVTHAFRACYQMLEIIDTRDLLYPIAQRKFLLEVKSGALDFNEISPRLNSLVDEVEEKLSASTLPEKVNVKKWQGFIINCYGI